MKENRVSGGFISSFCMELSLLSHAGIGIADGLHLLLEDEKDGAARGLLIRLAERTDAGAPLSAALRESGWFPPYVAAMTETGEQSGRPEEAFRALSEYYDSRERLSSRIRSALLYPAILLLLMLVVIVVLLVRVLPVFNEVFRQLGGELTGLAGGLLQLGLFLDGAMPVLCVLLLLLVLAGVALLSGEKLRAAVLLWYNVHWGDRGIAGEIAMTRLAGALSMGMRSGLPMEKALGLAASFFTENPHMAKRCQDCAGRLEQGDGLSQALRESGLLPPAYCRMLALGIRSGSGDTVMTEIARRLDLQSQESIEEKVGRVEPTLVIVTSLLVGAILLSVMLPLMNIMSVIG
ncbi:MAG: type II secretion system F family protein [Oscillospiraceae bacterium]